ncbi:MAG: cytochrome c oxidase subunit II [Burkholderiaceae bacterium]|nr:cytochrome c oxidase subunit II [Roseateles sp.]MBV8468888.1 cytochrome c oxidase subunit II [Burkholderiaceae bacterium]
MWMILALLAIVCGSLAFHVLSPWWTTSLASNWRQMDETLTITLVITGIFFVVINLFVVYCLLRFRHRAGHQAAYQPENKRLERWLIAVTSLGIAALLTPGLAVYASYLRPPPDAMVLEVVGQQWQWRFRFVGAAKKLGASDVRFVSGTNPLGLDPGDPAALANIVITGNEVHLPLNRPVKVLARSNDVLHDFFVPPMRARMNIVPGQVSSFWFTPTVAGRYEAMCAQLCGIGHPRMHGTVVVEDEAAFKAWLAAQPTFAATLAPAAAAVPAVAGDLVAQGRALAQSKGCAGCHSVDGSAGVGPTWMGLFGKTETFSDGSKVVMNPAELKRQILDPTSRVVKGFQPIMPKLDVKDDELDALVAYIQSVH